MAIWSLPDRCLQSKGPWESCNVQRRNRTYSWKGLLTGLVDAVVRRHCEGASVSPRRGQFGWRTILALSETTLEQREKMCCVWRAFIIKEKTRLISPLNLLILMRFVQIVMYVESKRKGSDIAQTGGLMMDRSFLINQNWEPRLTHGYKWFV